MNLVCVPDVAVGYWIAASGCVVGNNDQSHQTRSAVEKGSERRVETNAPECIYIL